MSDDSQRQNYFMIPAYDTIEHNHAFITIADVARDHQHGILGTTGPAIYRGKSHTHCIYVLTTSDPKGGPVHWHLVSIETGPAVEVPGDEHTHQFCGETSIVLGHKHSINSLTDTAPDKEDDKCDDKD